MSDTKLETLVVKSSFGVKLSHEKVVDGKPELKDGKPVMIEDEKRTEVEFELDFSKLSREQIAVYAAREYGRILNGEVRENMKDSTSGRSIESLQNAKIEVPVFVAGERGRGKITEDKAIAAIALATGKTIDEVNAAMAVLRGAAK